MTGRFFPVQTIHLGRAGTFASFNEATLPIGGHLGALCEDAGKVYRLVKHDNGVGNVATTATFAAHWKDRDAFVVTSDQTDAQAGINGVAGGYLGVITDLQYCFIQCGGKQTVSVIAATAAGDTMIGSTVDGQLARMPNANATYDGLPVAVAYTAVAGGTSSVYWILGALI